METNSYTIIYISTAPLPLFLITSILRTGKFWTIRCIVYNAYWTSCNMPFTQSIRNSLPYWYYWWTWVYVHGCDVPQRYKCKGLRSGREFGYATFFTFRCIVYYCSTICSNDCLANVIYYFLIVAVHFYATAFGSWGEDISFPPYHRRGAHLHSR